MTSEASIPEIVDLLFEGKVITLDNNSFDSPEEKARFIDNISAAKYRINKKFKSIGLEVSADDLILQHEVTPDCKLRIWLSPKTKQLWTIEIEGEV